MVDPAKPVVVARDGKTYVYVSGHNNTPNGADVVESVLIRAPWLDDKVQVTKPKTPQKRDVLSGNFGSNKKEISRDAVWAAAVRHLKELAPILAEKEAQLEEKIVTTRAQMKKEAL